MNILPTYCNLCGERILVEMDEKTKQPRVHAARSIHFTGCEESNWQRRIDFAHDVSSLMHLCDKCLAALAIALRDNPVETSE